MLNALVLQKLIEARLTDIEHRESERLRGARPCQSKPAFAPYNSPKWMNDDFGLRAQLIDAGREVFELRQAQKVLRAKQSRPVSGMVSGRASQPTAGGNMRALVWIVAFLLTGCSGAMKAVSADQKDMLDIVYQDGVGTRNVQAKSSSGENFVGTLVWIKDPGTAGRYRGALVGDKGRTLQVEMECNTFTAKCVGTARDNVGTGYFIR